MAAQDAQNTALPPTPPPVVTPPHTTPNPSNTFQQMYNQGGRFKEQLEAITGTVRHGGGVEHEPVAAGVREAPVEQVEEIPTNVELEKKPDLAGYMEKIEKDAELQQPVVDDYTQQVLMGSANVQNPRVKLPLTQQEIEMGLHHKVWEGIRWLSEWCVRQAKLLHGRVIYRDQT